MISIVLPVYNGSMELDKGLPLLKALLDDQQHCYEVIVVDDGSAMKESVQGTAHRHQCRYVRNERNAGKGMAVKRGVQTATGDIIIFMDGDFPFNLSIIPAMIQALQTSQVAIGDRTHEASRFPHNIRFSRKWGSRVLSWVISRFYVSDIRDSQCGIKGFRSNTGKAIFNKVTLNGFSFDVEVLFIARKNHYQIARLPVEVYEQPASSVRILRDGLRMLGSLCSISFNNLSGKYTIDE